MSFQSNAFQSNAFQMEDAAPVVGGHGKKHRQTLRLPRRTVIEIGGETFVIGNQADAEAVLAQARALAPQTAQNAAERALRKRVRVRSGLAPIAPLPPVVRLLHTAPDYDVQQLWAQIDAANAAFEAIYARAWRQAMDDDEDEALALLL